MDYPRTKYINYDVISVWETFSINQNSISLVQNVIFFTAFALVDAGYDVWLLNARGNYYSRRHKTLNPDVDAVFWNFTIHEHGYYDLANSIDYVLNITNQDSVQFIGHSMGGTAGLILCSARPEYNNKIRLFVNFAPLSHNKYRIPSPAIKYLISDIAPPILVS